MIMIEGQSFRSVYVDTIKFCGKVAQDLETPMQLALETFAPAEAEEITGVTQFTVRNWRRAGHLPRPSGHARYSVKDILFMTAMQMLVARGVTPEAAKDLAGEAMRGALLNLARSQKAYSADVVRQAEKERDEISPNELARLKAALGERFDVNEIERVKTIEWMLDQAEQAFGMAGIKAPSWLIIWANGEAEFYHDEDISEEKFFGNAVFDDYLQGPVILFSLGAITSLVLGRLPRPAIKLAEEA